MAACDAPAMTIAAALLISLVQTAPAAPQAPEPPTPASIVAAAPRSDWRTIPAADLLVMDLAPESGKPRRVVIQLVPAPFAAGWTANMRRLAAAHWWDGTAVVRVQDNYVTQWGDPTEKKPMPPGIAPVPESAYVTSLDAISDTRPSIEARDLPEVDARARRLSATAIRGTVTANAPQGWHERDSYAEWVELVDGWPIAADKASAWMPHCYGMVGVGRNYSPDTGSGAELYTVIGHAPRHLDRNIALVGRVIEGMEHLSSLPRGKGALGFYTAEEAAKRTPILSVRVASDLAPAEQPAFEYLSTESATFATYAEAIANRRDPFFIVPAGGADVCNIRVPVRRVAP